MLLIPACGPNINDRMDDVMPETGGDGRAHLRHVVTTGENEWWHVVMIYGMPLVAIVPLLAALLLSSIDSEGQANSGGPRLTGHWWRAPSPSCPHRIPGHQVEPSYGACFGRRWHLLEKKSGYYKVATLCQQTGGRPDLAQQCLL